MSKKFYETWRMPAGMYVSMCVRIVMCVMLEGGDRDIVEEWNGRRRSGNQRKNRITFLWPEKNPNI